MVGVTPLFLLCVSVLSYSSQTLIVATADGPPHMIEYNQSGIDVDIIRELLRQMDIESQFKFVGLGRARVGVKNGHFDAMVPTFVQKDEPGFYVSDPVIAYKPTVFSLARNQFVPQTLSQLKGHSLASFQGAKGYFGKDFINVTDASPYYSEITNMKTIPILIYKERFDYAILDKYIFYYYFRLQDKKRNINVFSEHDLIPSAYAGVGFSDKNIRDRFNKVAKGFVASDAYASILAKYVGSIDEK